MSWAARQDLADQLRPLLVENAGKPWVWTGLRGVYTLKDWGYEQPAVGLYEGVLEIVTRFCRIPRAWTTSTAC